MTCPASFPSTPVTLDGVTKTVEEWCQERRLKVSAVHLRRRRCSWAEALTPVKQGERLKKVWA